jgi:rSAM/selenodomain-associated transferase 2/rSAM/selenodomain-associated transferase 1
VDRLLLVFARVPEPGVAKTRLIPALGPEGAARLQRRMTARTLAAVAGAPGWRSELRLAGSGAGRTAGVPDAACRCVPQGDGDLGERLRRAFAEGFASGAAAVAAIGTDCPGLGAADVADAFRALETHDAVFGPACDGGYWIVGLRRQAFERAGRELFAGIPWGGPAVLSASRDAAAGAGLSVASLRTLADVDRPADLAEWERALRGDEAGEAICVVVPALEEAPRIGALVRQLRAEAGVDVVVADGGSCDGTAAAAAAAGARVVVGARGRAQQMNAGAAAADGAILLFLHADTCLPPGWAAAVRALLRAPGVSGGAFTFATDSPRAGLRWIEAAAAWRGRLLGAVFGDQAIFTRRESFAALGGFPEQPLMEDWEFVRRLRRRGRVVVLPQKAVSSARRWERRGALRTSLANAAITAAYLAGVSPRRLAGWYGRGGLDRPGAGRVDS